MHIDEYGLPTQANGDKNDQLQRVGMIVTAMTLSYPKVKVPQHIAMPALVALNSTMLQPKLGIYVRYVGGDPANVSADQLISALCAHVASTKVEPNTPQILRIILRTLMRFGFAQNYKDGLDGKERIKIPDFLLLRGLPLFLRVRKILYPLTILSDLLLVALTLSAVGPVWADDKGFRKRSQDDVDDNNTILSLVVCNARMPTPLSKLAAWIYAKNRPWNFGCAERIEPLDDRFIPIGPYTYHPVIGALRWYHRAESGGNPEVAEALIPLVNKYILRAESKT